MGWLYFYKPTNVKAVDAIKGSVGEKWWNERVVAASATLEAVHLVVKCHEPDSTVYVPDADGMVRVIVVYKISRRPTDLYNFGYKDMTETMGPYGCECAPSIIAAASPLQPKPISDDDSNSSLRSAHEYRERSLAAFKAKNAKKALKVGARVKLPNALSFGNAMLDEFTVVRVWVRGKQKTAFRATQNGMLCGLTGKHIIDAEIS